MLRCTNQVTTPEEVEALHAGTAKPGLHPAREPFRHALGARHP